MKRQSTKLTVAYRSIPKLSDLDFAVVRTMDVHDVLILLGAGPLFSWGPHIENIYAAEVISKDFANWTVGFKSGQKFSDGSPLTAEHWFHSVARAVKLGAGVHFNPKKDLVGGASSTDGYCDGLVLAGNEVQLKLTEPNRKFDRLIGKVEASVLPILDSSVKLDFLKLPTSGAYSIESYEPSHVLLKRNPNFPGHKDRAQFDQIEIVKMPDEEAFEARIKGAVDFIFPATHPSKSIEKSLNAKSQIHRDFGQTTFLSFRPKHLADKKRKWHHNVECRQALATILRKLPESGGYSPTGSILMGEGMGRLDDGPSFKAKLSVKDLPPLSIAVVDRPQMHAIVEFLSDAGLNVSAKWVKSFNDLYAAEVLETDAIIGWNDYCGEDPYIALYNSLNPDRPLFLDDGRFRNELTKIQMLTDAKNKDDAYRDLHKKLLETVSVLPLYSYWSNAYAAPHLNLAELKGSVLWTLGKS